MIIPQPIHAGLYTHTQEDVSFSSYLIPNTCDVHARSREDKCPLLSHKVSRNLFLSFLVHSECALADYVSGIQSEKVPFVFLPVQGQLINPNAEIALSGKQSTLGSRTRESVDLAPPCATSSSTRNNNNNNVFDDVLHKMYGLKAKWSSHLFASSPKPIF